MAVSELIFTKIFLFHLRIAVRYDFHCTHFHKAHNHSMVLRGDPCYRFKHICQKNVEILRDRQVKSDCHGSDF